jgi:hypothetical protein
MLDNTAHSVLSSSEVIVPRQISGKLLKRGETMDQGTKMECAETKVVVHYSATVAAFFFGGAMALLALLITLPAELKQSSLVPILVVIVGCYAGVGLRMAIDAIVQSLRPS